jgi:hypothetical protein
MDEHSQWNCLFFTTYAERAGVEEVIKRVRPMPSDTKRQEPQRLQVEQARKCSFERSQ